MKIAVDMGHCLNGADSGATGLGRREQDLTREIGNKVIPLLQKAGHEVINVTVDSANSVNESLSARVNKSNSNNVDLYISIHLNAFNGQAYGTEVYTYNAIKRDRAVRVLNNIVGLGYTNRGIKDGSNLYVIKNTNMESMLVECCFIDNTGDMGRFNSDNMARAIAEGIHGSSIIVEEPKPQPTDNNIFYRVVTGSYKDRANAEAQVNKLKQAGFDSFIDVYRK